MADNIDGSLLSPTGNNRKPTSFFSSSKLFTSFSGKNFGEAEVMMSPTSILDTKPYGSFINPFWNDTKSPKRESRVNCGSKGVGLGLVDALIDEKSESKQLNCTSRMVVFGSQLKIQIPSVVSAASSSPSSPSDFGIKTRNSQWGSFMAKKSPFGSPESGLENPNSGSVHSCLSASEMELSEDYTCVISYGPNPRTTHIFDDCIVESCFGVARCSEPKKGNGLVFTNRSMSYPSQNFLSFCHTCKNNLGLGKDIYMYRGEKAFCSIDCRDREMMLEEEGMQISEFEEGYDAFTS
ncbi:PREDICTED: protein MARD1 isoform X1 [Ipomoea nil]|uniref:protein MARD1 isoform X1 n=1 Tax=Ipomoea nil TaxID=35883 RepID=UPI000900A163|nr:PREDICTED: protein MARD1 isoform X1 [Ipomoea nil]